jgi:seryl-tRNA synthetase
VTDRSPEAYLAELLSAGLLEPSGVDGVYGRGAEFEQALAAVDGLFLRETAGDGPEPLRFPPVLPRAVLERTGYLASFPHLATSVFGFEGTEADGAELVARVQRKEDWSELLTSTDLMLLPAACYPVYPLVAEAGPLPAGGRLIDVQSYCFRREPSRDPMRMQAFRMHENVRIGSEEDVVAWRGEWLIRAAAFLESIGLAADTVPASDPFFGKGGRMLSANQVEQGLKLELVYPIAGDRPTAVFSVNYHQDHFGHDFGIETQSGEVAHSACCAAGLERITLALFATHGLQLSAWPEPILNRLALPRPTV